MDPQVVVVVLGLAAFVSDGGKDTFYVMLPENSFVHEVLNANRDPNRTAAHPAAHQARLMRYDEAKQTYVAVDLDQDFEISLPGAHAFNTDGALILATGSTALRKECTPGADLAKCTYKDASNELPIVHATGTIHRGKGRMVPFDSTGASWSDWSQTKLGTVSVFVSYSKTNRFLTTLGGKAQATLGDAFIVESDGIPSAQKRPTVSLGGKAVELGLAPNCRQWTDKAEPCYPLVISNLPPPGGMLTAEWNELPAYTDLAVADAHVNVIYELLERKETDPRPVPLEIWVGPTTPGGSPYKCRSAGIEVTP